MGHPPRLSTGRVVCKLIGIAGDGRLVGFRTYSALSDRAGNAALRALVRRYVADFAARCRLELADSGTVPTLFPDGSYDDGVVPWAQDAPATVSASV